MGMRRALVLTLAGSLALHAAVGAFAVGRGERAPARSDAPKDEAAATLAGDSFELPAPESGAQSLSADRVAIPVTPDALRPLAPAPVTRHAAPAAAHATASSDADPAEAHGPPELYGAAGDRSAVQVAVAFTRALPQAASGDEAWLSAPLGAAGALEVALSINDAGVLEGAAVSGNAGVALQRAADRTLALIRARTFTAAAPVTRLRIEARVSPDEVHDGLHGDVFALGGSFSGGEGSAFFALAAGRRIDVTITEIHQKGALQPDRSASPRP
jgi:hypothetical protein